MNRATYLNPDVEIEIAGGWANALKQWCVEHYYEDVCKSFRRAIINEDVRYKIVE